MSADSQAARSTEIGLGLALAPLGSLLALFVIGGLLYGLGIEVLIVSMLLSALVAGAIAASRGASWDDVQRSTGEKLASVLPAILILLSIGMLIGAWVLSGTIPFLVSLGIRLVDPRFFVVTAFVVTAVMSLSTGTSWGSAGTLGVALMGSAAVVGAPLAATAGAVLSGAYFGDKMSPLSDTTNICAIGAGADLYAHIRHMLYTALPSVALCLVVYGFLADSGAPSADLPPSAVSLLAEIDRVFDPGLVSLVPVGVVLLGIALRVPPVLALGASSALALALGALAGGFGIENALTVVVRGFDRAMVVVLGIEPTSLSADFVRLLERGGLYSMVNTLVVILAAFLMAAGMDVSGGLDRILRSLLGAVRSVFGLIVATLTAGATMISLTSHAGVTALIVGGMFQRAYRERDLAPENLSRSLEDSVTILEPLLPWTVSAIFMATTLGVPTLDYLPWAVFCYGGPVFSFLYAALSGRSGFGVKRMPHEPSRGPEA